MRALPKNKEETAKELLSFYPTFLKNVTELAAIQSTLGNEFDKLLDIAQQLLDDSNITTASESIIEFYEKIIGIQYSSLRTLEERRRLVLAYYNIFGKVSATKIKNAINYYTGADVDVRFTNRDEKGNYILEIECVRGNINSIFIEDIALLCKKIIPAHLLMAFSVTILPKGNLYAAALPQISTDITVYTKE